MRSRNCRARLQTPRRLYTAGHADTTEFDGDLFRDHRHLERRRLFQTEAKARLFLETLQQYRAQDKYKLHAFVVMPDHVHLLITPSEITIERAVGLIKGGFSYRMGSKLPVWQKGFVERRMRDAEEFVTRREYVHQNPVRARLAMCAEDYPFSSAFRNRTAAAEAAGS